MDGRNRDHVSDAPITGPSDRDQRAHLRRAPLEPPDLINGPINNHHDTDQPDEEETPVMDDSDVEEDEEQNQDVEPTPTPPLPPHLKKMTDGNGILPPTIQSRTRQQAHAMGETLTINGVIPTLDDNVSESKKQRKKRTSLETRLLKQVEEENKKKLKNKLKHDKKKMKLKIKREAAHPNKIIDGDAQLLDESIEENKTQAEHGISNVTAETVDETDEAKDEYGDLRDELLARQKPGVSFLSLIHI